MRRGSAHPPLHGLTRLGFVCTVSALALLATPADGVTAASTSPGQPFTFTFSGNPTVPQPWKPADWDVVVSSRDTATFAQLEGMQAQHGADCGPYPATHLNNSYEGAVFLCHNHVMTAINAHGYGEIVLTPNHMIDFGKGETTISFNLSTLRTSFRDWVDIWITPFEENLVLPLDEPVDLQGPPKHAIHVRMNQTTGTIFRGELIDNFKVTRLPDHSAKTLDQLVGTTSAVTRTKLALTISPTHLKFGAPSFGYNWVDTAIPRLSWARGVVQLAHHSYNPTKQCTPSPKLACLPNTWHWSDFYVSNAVPFTLLRGDPQVVHGTPALVKFSGLAPESSFLRFAGIGSAFDLSFNGGKTWQPAQRQAQEFNYIEHFSSFWTPVPRGTTSVTIRGHDWKWGPWWIRDISIWSTSLATKAPSTPVPSGAAGKPPALQASPLQAVLAAFRTPPGLAAGIAILVAALGSIFSARLLIRRRRSRPHKM